jgi:predicted phage tail protein
LTRLKDAYCGLTIGRNNNRQTGAVQIQSKEQAIQELKENIRSMQEDMKNVFEVLRIVKRDEHAWAVAGPDHLSLHIDMVIITNDCDY